MLKAILAATDASEAAERAVTVAADLASRYDAKLIILHVIRDMQLPEELRQMARVEHIQGQRMEVLTYVGERILRDAEELARRKGAKEVVAVSGEGDPATVVIDEARTRGADLIVIGTRGLGKVEGMFMGSVSRKVTNLAETDCYIVR